MSENMKYYQYCPDCHSELEELQCHNFRCPKCKSEWHSDGISYIRGFRK